jgi:phosphoribosylformylglycinamidine cyclo-ligase
MTDKGPITYKDAGVDIDAVSHALRSVGELARATHTPQVLTGIGSFGALFRPDFSQLEVPVLVSSTDGVGTKLMVARRVGRYDTVGADLVNHCINDILVMGAEPLFFLDYIAAGRFPEGFLEALVTGFATACRQHGVPLIGGETAEMPGLYGQDDFDLAGFVVGVADEKHLLVPERVADGDVLIALGSSGLHTNGYSLAQKILFEQEGLEATATLPGLDGSIGEALLATHRCYLEPLRDVLRDPDLHGLVHITGGGFTDNVPRILPEGLGAMIDRGSWTPLPIFVEMARRGPVERDEMDRTFNMGVGMIVVVDPRSVDRFSGHLRQHGESPWVIGHIESGNRQVRYEGPATL